MRDALAHMWPTSENVDACVRTDAEMTDPAVLLAVHQPMRFRRHDYGVSRETVVSCDERDLLEVFVRDDPPDGRVIAPIVGSPGVGKSHVVRWLDAQLQSRPDRDRRLVIRVPKGSSLRQVLGLLLDKMEGEAYNQLRDALHSAREGLSPELAARYLQQNLSVALREVGEAAQARLRAQESTDRRADEQRVAFCQPNMLPAFMDDAYVWEHHFYRRDDGSRGVVAQLAEQVTTEGNSDIDDRLHMFDPDHLVLDDDVLPEYLSRDAGRFYTQLRIPAHREAASALLNEVLDLAKQMLLNVGDGSLTELFATARAGLLEEGRELVLLVEDFAVLSGLQGALLDAMIRDAFRDGRQVLCTMRTALAYTTGYSIPDTVHTRAGSEWLIEDVPGEESEHEILGRVTEMVGAYLNAARVGQEALAAAYRRASASGNPHDWVPSYEPMEHEPDVAEALEDFGITEAGYSLFPLSGAAIRQLTREGSQGDGRVVMNPRNMIHNVLRHTLYCRDAFLSDEFPPATFGRESLRNADVADFVDRACPRDQVGRALRVLAYWGEQPGSLAEANQVPASVFSAFGLDTPRFGVDSGRTQPESPPTPEPAPEAEPTGRQTGEDSADDEWQGLLERWHSGEELPERHANQLRTWLYEAVAEAIPWDWYLFRGPRGVRTRPPVFVPAARGHRGVVADEACVALCSEAELRDPVESARVRQALIALIRFQRRGDWDYDRGDIDSARYAALIARLQPRAVTYLRARYFHTPVDTTLAMVEALAIGARALALPSATKAGPDALTDALLQLAPEQLTTGVEKWDEARAGLSRIRTNDDKQDSWVEFLLDQIGARQGGANAVHAVDGGRIKDVLARVSRTWSFGESLPPAAAADASYRLVREEYQRLKRSLPSAIQEATEIVRQRRRRMTTFLGEDFDKAAVVDALSDAITQVVAVGSWDVNRAALREVLRAFGEARVAEVFEDAGRLGEDATPGTVLSVLGRQHIPSARVVDTCIDVFDRFLTTQSEHVRSELEAVGIDVVEESLEALRGEIARVGKCLDVMEGVRS